MKQNKREMAVKKLNNISKYFLGLVVAGAVCASAHGDMAPNARAASNGAAATSRSSGRTAGRSSDSAVSHSSKTTASRSATRRTADVTATSRSAVARTAVANDSRAATTRRVLTGLDTNRAAATRTSRAASSNTIRGNISRSATPVNMGVARAATPSASRAGVARATAVFTDVSKIGGGYAACRDSYSTCMDQFCAMANDTYRRCFCSDRFTGFRDVEVAMDEATAMLTQFENTYINAVDKTAAEVDAMFGASAGEAAIKTDTSAAAELLGSIGDLLAGKKVEKKTASPVAEIPTLDLDFTSGLDDVWGDGGDIFADTSSVFGSSSSSSGPSITEMEGKQLYNEAHKQCLELAGTECSSAAVLNMAKSSYEILISQDCNAYEKNIDKKKSKVEDGVRKAEKVLREARLNEYRAHNSQDVNECIDKVRTAVLADTACGQNYKRCLDHTGLYVNISTGEPIYSARLFQLQSLIRMDGGAEDQKFMEFLDTRKMFANQALDSCRDQADLVWTEFKRTALIEISQAQEEKLEEVRMSCVNTMKECYDTQGGALKSFDDTTSKAAGALSVYAARDMCKEKVSACALLYANGDTAKQCTFDADGHITNKEGCGLAALLSFVEGVDNTRVGEACGTSVETYLKSMCDSKTEGTAYPWGCRKKKIGAENDAANPASNASLWANIKAFTAENCADPTGTYADTVTPETVKGGQAKWDSLSSQAKLEINNLVSELRETLDAQMSAVCNEKDGYWVAELGSEKFLAGFYSTLYGKVPTSKDADGISDLGYCVENSKRMRCLSYNTTEDNDMATYDLAKDTCTFTPKWYQSRCAILGNGVYEDGMCYIMEPQESPVLVDWLDRKRQVMRAVMDAAKGKGIAAMTSAIKAVAQINAM